MSDLALRAISTKESETLGYVIDGEWTSLKEVMDDIIPDGGGFQTPKEWGALVAKPTT